MDAIYVTEVIDVEPPIPRYRRYFDPEDPTRPIVFETIRTLDADRDGRIGDDELARSIQNKQFDLEGPGNPRTWGKVRWRGQMEGRNADVLVRVRTGTSPDTHVYNRRIGTEVLSPFIEQELVANTGWPARGTRIDAFMFTMLSGLTCPSVEQLPYNTPSDRDGAEGGWTYWSAPFSFSRVRSTTVGMAVSSCRCRR